MSHKLYQPLLKWHILSRGGWDLYHTSMINRATIRRTMCVIQKVSLIYPLAGKRTFANTASRVEEDNAPRVDRATPILEEIFSSPPQTTSDWENVLSDLREKVDNRGHWPTRLMKIFQKDSQTSHTDNIHLLSSSLLNYAQQYENTSGKRMPISLLISYLSICGNFCYNSENPSDMQIRVKDIFETIRSRTEVFDSQSSGEAISALCSTNDHWRLSLPILEDEKLVGRPGAYHYCPIANASFRNGEEELGWELLEEMARAVYKQVGSSVNPDEEFYLKYFQNNKDFDHAQKLLFLMNKHQWIPSESSALLMLDFFKRHGWTGKAAEVSHNEICQECDTKMPKEGLSSEEFEELRESFLDRCLRKEDVFFGTTPQELSRFHSFLEKNGKFDIVIDGLNVGLQLSKGKSNRRPSQQLLNVVERLSRHGRILVCGRKHMNKWSKDDMKRLTSFASIFYAENTSSDDPFMVYAALYSGQNTKVVTRDMLRDHRFLLPTGLRSKFNIWQRTHQISFEFDRGLKFTWPKFIDTRVHLSNENIHIPFEDNEERPSHELPKSWICLSKELKQKM